MLLVGCGGLGSPCGLYLAAAGIGKIGLLDYDKVDTSNLHRQIVHSESTIGMQKTESALERLQTLNSNLQYEVISSKLSRANAVDIIEKFDIVVDGSDNAPTRYMVSDACVISKKPLVSGAALKFEGQLTTYNYDENTPCYRCLFPSPPPAHTVTNCSDGGVLGVVPGIIGSLQALEVIKIALGMKPSYAGRMLLFDGLGGQFREVKIRNKKVDCAACGTNPTINRELIDYEKFCGTPACEQARMQNILTLDERITCREYKSILDQKQSHLLIDVRPSVQANIVKLENAINIPLETIVKGEGLKQIEHLIEEKSVKQVYFMCRRGIASQQACRVVKERLNFDSVEFKDVIGGITSWSEEIDPSVPVY